MPRGGGTRYRLAVLKNFEEPSMLKRCDRYTVRISAGSRLLYGGAGEKAVPVEKGERFAVVRAYYDTAESRYPIAVGFYRRLLGSRCA